MARPRVGAAVGAAAAAAASASASATTVAGCASTQNAATSGTLPLYRAILRAGRGYPDYNIRAYVLRKARADFRAGAALPVGGPAALAAHAAGEAALALLRRQSVIAGFYAADMPSVMESTEARAGAAQVAAERRRGLR